MNATDNHGGLTLRAELTEFAEKAACRNRDHPYFRALCDGSLPQVVYDHYSVQDSLYMLPGYGRAHARCSVLAEEPCEAQFLSKIATFCLENYGWPHASSAVEPDKAVIAPTTLNYTSFLTAACVTSFATGLGALLPSAWLHLLISDHLLAQHEPGSRYADVITASHPGEEYRRLVEQFLVFVDGFGRRCSAGERAALVRHAEYASRYEWAFIDAAWRLESWPI